MIDLTKMSKQEVIITSSLMAGILLLTAIIFTPSNLRRDRKSSAPANVLASGGGPGNTQGYFQTPRAIAVDPEKSIYIVDSRNNRIQKFNEDGVFVREWGKEGEKPGEFKEPCGLDVGPDGKVYVADTWNSRVQVFDYNGKFLKEYGKEQGMWGPRGICVDKAGNVYVTNTGHGKIEKFNSDGKFIMTLGAKGTKSGEFQEPFGIKQGPDSNLYIADRKNFRIQVLTTEGKFVREFKVDGWAEGQIVNGCLMEPYLDIDAKRGLIYITDSTNHRVMRYDLNGRNHKVFMKDEQGADMFACPLGIAIGGDGKIFVTDSGVSKMITFADRN